jgi:hypothetical protein
MRNRKKVIQRGAKKNKECIKGKLKNKIFNYSFKIRHF